LYMDDEKKFAAESLMKRLLMILQTWRAAAPPLTFFPVGGAATNVERKINIDFSLEIIIFIIYYTFYFIIIIIDVNKRWPPQPITGSVHT
jgi:hypothetical protein